MRNEEEPHGRAQIVDAAVHPQFARLADLRTYMHEPWRSRSFPGLDRIMYSHPSGEFLPDELVADRLPGSDLADVERGVFVGDDVEVAILLPLTRNLHPDVDLDSAICAATNDWLADVWLTQNNPDRRFRGSIRICPREPERAVREIERWAGHPDMVQIAVPLQAHHPYGQRQYFPIWQAAARHELPVAVHWEPGFGVEFVPTAAGQVRHFIEYSTLYPLNFGYHLANLISEGVFDRLENLTFVFADGGYDMLMAFSNRLDSTWRATHRDHPWSKQLPTLYYRDHVRFITSRLEGPQRAEEAEWLELGDAEHLLMFGSNYPYWDYDVASAAAERFDGAVRDRIMGGTAQLYRLA